MILLLSQMRRASASWGVSMACAGELLQFCVICAVGQPVRALLPEDGLARWDKLVLLRAWSYGAGVIANRPQGDQRDLPSP
jgi:hypothetical protein